MAGPVRQQLIADGFTYETLSVDRLDTQTKQCLPYIYFKSVIYEKRLRIFRKCDLLTEEIIGLERESDGHINHMENGTMGSKDLSDAVCGSIYSASQHAEQFAYDYGENLDLFYDTNINNDSADFINSSFEQELTNALLKNNNIIQDKKQDSNFLDFGMGKPVDYVSCDVLNGIIVF